MKEINHRNYFFAFLDRYVWEIGWRYTFEASMYSDGMIIVAVKIRGTILWFDGGYDHA